MKSIEDLPEEFKSKIAIANEDHPVMGSPCWIWTGIPNAHGYGRIMYGGVRYCAHRWIYMLLVGKVPDGLELDHLCRVKRCVSPLHLEAVTHLENIRRGESPSAICRRKPCCPKCGGPYEIVFFRGKGTRTCHPCRLAYFRRYNKIRRSSL